MEGGRKRANWWRQAAFSGGGKSTGSKLVTGKPKRKTSLMTAAATISSPQYLHLRHCVLAEGYLWLAALSDLRTPGLVKKAGDDLMTEGGGAISNDSWRQ